MLLLKQADIGEVIFGTILAIGTLSTICLVPDAPAICDQARIATADADGRYEFDLEGLRHPGHARHGVDPHGHLLRSAQPRAARRSASPPRTPRSRSRTPDCGGPSPGCRAAPARSASRGRPYRPRPAATRRTRRRCTTPKGQLPLWSQPASGGETSIDSRILEDRPARSRSPPSTDLSGGSGAGDLRASFLSARLPVDATAGAPPSRGRPCAAVTGTARPRSRRPDVLCGHRRRPDRGRAPHQPARAGSSPVSSSTSAPPDRSASSWHAGFCGPFLVEVSDDGTTYRRSLTSLGQLRHARPTGSRPHASSACGHPPAWIRACCSELSVW